jgi:hypothetical protein
MSQVVQQLSAGGPRLTDRLCVQLSVEVNGSLVGDSPYLIMFDVDDNVAPDQDEEALRAMPTGSVRPCV